MSKHKKTFTILGLTAAVIILTGAIFFFSQSPEQTDPDTPLDETIGDVAVSGIEGDTPTIEPDITPDAIGATAQPEQSGNTNEIELTKIEDKPDPPELPENVHETIPSTEESGAATNPDVKPDSTPKPSETTPPKETTPNAGDKKDGQIYIPGFGWVEDEGGGGQGEKTGSDGDWDKIIGH